MQKINLSRRDFLKMAGLTAGTLSGLGGLAFPLSKVAAQDMITIRVARGEHPAQPMLQDTVARQAIAEHTGVQMELIITPSADYDAKLQVWMSTNQVPDLVEVDRVEDILPYAREGVLLPLNDLIAEYAPNIQRYLDDNPEMYKFAVDGELYYLPGYRYNFPRNATMPMIRHDLLEELGLDAPTNFDELFEVLLAFKEARPDAVVWANRSGTARLLTNNAYMMGSGYGMYFDKDVDGGKWLYGGIHEEFKYVLDYFAKAYAAGVLDQDYSITTADQWHQKNSSGSGLFCIENMQFGARWNQALRAEDPDATWGPLQTLAGQKGARQVDYPTLIRGYAIGANAANPERIIQMMDWMISPIGLEITNWGLEGVHYTIDFELPESFPDYKIETLARLLPPDQRTIVPEVFEEYAAKTDPFRSFQSDTGTGLLDFAVFVDSSVINTWAEPGEQDQWFELTENDPGLGKQVFPPPFNQDESEEIADIQVDVETILDPAYEKVILGQMTMDEFDGEVARALDAGAERLEEIYAQAEERLNS